MARTHAELDAIAAAAGHEWSEDVSTVAEKEAELDSVGIGPRVFRLRDDLEDRHGQEIWRYTTGSFVFELGETVEAPTPEIAVKFAADPNLEEVA